MGAPFQNKSAELLLKVAENLDVIIIMKEILFLRTTYKCHLTPSFLPLQLQVFDNRMTQSRRFKVKEQTHAGGSYHPCSCRGQTSAHSLCCSTAEPCWPRGLRCLLLHCTVCTRSLAFRYVPSHRPCLQVLMPRSGLQKFLQPGRKERSRRTRRLVEKWERGGSPSLSGSGLAEWKIKIAAHLPPTPTPLSQFTAVKTYLGVGADIPPGECRLSQTGLPRPGSSHNRTDNSWISCHSVRWIHCRDGKPVLETLTDILIPPCAETSSALLRWLCSTCDTELITGLQGRLSTTLWSPPSSGTPKLMWHEAIGREYLIPVCPSTMPLLLCIFVPPQDYKTKAQRFRRTYSGLSFV